MALYRFGDVQIFRPSYAVEDAIRQRATANLYSRFSPGEYRGAKAANEIVKHHFAFYESLLQPLIPKLASIDAAAFLLSQYDSASRILHGHGVLDLNERERWSAIEGNFKRAIKYLIELFCMASPKARPAIQRDEAQSALESALVCAECMAELSHNSEVLHSVFPDDCVVRVFDAGPLAFEIKVEGAYISYDQKFRDRVIRDRESRQRFVGFPQFDNHTATHQRYLDEAFRKSFGMGYGEFVASVKMVIDDCQPSLHPNALPALFVHRGHVIDELSKTCWPRAAIECALDGFTVSRTSLIAEQRVVWKPKQESRAYRRGFFLFRHETGSHLAFSREMARECLIQLVNWVSYKRLPAEWKTSVTSEALEKLSRAASEWFEETVCRNLNALKITGRRMHRTVGSGQIRIPESVGEIDFLGYQPQQKLLVLVESKMVMTGLEGRYWRDDLDEFVLRQSSYAERFRRKISWVKENRDALSSALAASPAAGVGVAMLTLYPCIAGAFVSGFPCVSLTEFMLDYERQKQWPYPVC